MQEWDDIPVSTEVLDKLEPRFFVSRGQHLFDKVRKRRVLLDKLEKVYRDGL